MQWESLYRMGMHYICVEIGHLLLINLYTIKHYRTGEYEVYAYHGCCEQTVGNQLL